jgi:hypothetical protein
MTSVPKPKTENILWFRLVLKHDVRAYQCFGWQLSGEGEQQDLILDRGMLMHFPGWHHGFPPPEPDRAFCEALGCGDD